MVGGLFGVCFGAHMGSIFGVIWVSVRGHKMSVLLQRGVVFQEPVLAYEREARYN